MKHLFVIRHGHNFKADLSEQGKKQIERLVKDMRAVVGELYNGHYLISSTAPRAEQTADIIAKAFGLNSFDTDKRLFTNNEKDLSLKELEEVDGMIASHKDVCDIVTIITHYEVVNSYPRYVVKRLFGINESTGYPEKGQGVHIDLDARTYKYVPIRHETLFTHQPKDI